MPNTASTGALREQEHNSDRLEERLNQKTAAKDPLLKGAASTLAKVDAEMRAAGVPEKDRITVRQNASHELAKIFAKVARPTCKSCPMSLRPKNKRRKQ